MTQSSANPVSEFLRDARQFVLEFEYVLKVASLQIYCSALVFAPETSLVRQIFLDQVRQEVDMLCTRESDWSRCRSMLVGHSGWVTAVAFSLDGQLIVSASADRTVRVWEVATGRCYSTLEGHSDYVKAVAFSPDRQLIASASADSTVRVWEAATGRCRSTVEGLSSWVTTVAFSPDGQVIYTSAGDIPVSFPLTVPLPSQQRKQPFTILVQDDWILRNQQRLLWLPHEYRTRSFAVHREIVCLGLLFGRVVLLRIR
jgi:WD40 repeat protein